MSKIAVWASSIVGVLAVVAFIHWFVPMMEARDAQIATNAEAYEECVKREYGGRTPQAWYAETGEWPECEITK